MVEFCSCGSIMQNGSCTNKNCSNKVQIKAPAKKKASGTKAAKPVSSKRASKCVTYSINELGITSDQEN